MNSRAIEAFLSNAAGLINPITIAMKIKITGGTSSINGQIFLRGLSHDFNEWNSYGVSGWNYSDVLPFFRKLETDLDFSGDFHGTDGPIMAKRFPKEEWAPPQNGFHSACQEAGFAAIDDFNLPDAEGVGPFPCNNPKGIRLSTALGYLAGPRHRMNLTIRDRCHVKKILIEKNKAVGVELESGSQTYVVEGENISGSFSSPPVRKMVIGLSSDGAISSKAVLIVRNALSSSAKLVITLATK